MTRLTRNATSRFIKLVKITMATIASAQALSIMILTAIDTLRKFRSSSRPEGYPIIDPYPIKAAGNEVTAYMEGVAVYSDMLEAIDNARESVLFETYIWKGDYIGSEFKKALIRAAERGVDVYMIWDTFGNMVVRPSFFTFPSLKHLHPLRYPLPHSGRDHRKILVVDGQVGFIGGYNIGDTYASLEWRDTHIKVVGPAVWELQNAFTDFWNRARKRRFAKLYDSVMKPLFGYEHSLPELPDLGAKSWDADVRASINDPQRLLFPIRGSYIDILDRAVESAYITSAYFIPDDQIKDALIAAHKRGVDVKVLVPGKSNHIVADWISRAYISELLKAGVEIWLYEDVMIHAKTAVIDGKWSTVGTANIDRMSMTGNHEINLEIFDKAMAQVMEKIFLTDLRNAHRITWEEWNNRPYIQRLVERILRPLGPLI